MYTFLCCHCRTDFLGFSKKLELLNNERDFQKSGWIIDANLSAASINITIKLKSLELGEKSVPNVTPLHPLWVE
jgi:hypothetical protein